MVTLHLNDNVITYICPQLLALAPKLVYLCWSGNRLLEIADLRLPPRMQLTDVLLTNNPFRCLTDLCWMLFVPKGSYLQLKMENTFCVDGDDIEINIIAGLTTECTCALTVSKHTCYQPQLNWQLSLYICNICLFNRGTRAFIHTYSLDLIYIFWDL